jgi:uncharacterized protein (TIGR02996 family)
VSTSSLAQLETHLRETPEDWQSWLVYADWLLDQGDERGRLIQLEHRLALSPGDARLQREIDKLQKAGSWQPARALRSGGGSLLLRHGFVCGLSLYGEGAATKLRRLLAGPNMQFLTSLELADLSGRGVAFLSEVLPQTHIRRVRMERVQLGQARLTRLLPALGQLETLELYATQLGDEGMAQLCQAQSLRGLRSLSLMEEWLTERGAAALASGALSSLRALSLARNELGSAGARRVARAETLRGLVSLNLDRTELESEGVDALAEGGLPQLRSLSLEGNPLYDRDALRIASSPALRELVSLEISSTRVTDDGVLALARSLRQLVTLGVRGLEVSAEAQDEFTSLRPDLDARWQLYERYERERFVDDDDDFFYD